MNSVEYTPLLAVCTAGLSAAFTYAILRLSAPLRLLALPRVDRWSKGPTPNTGGLAVLLASAIAYAIAAPRLYIVIASAAATMAVVGFLDDRIGLRPWVKLAAQFIAALAVVYSGVIFAATSLPLLNVIVTLLWITGITNAINLIDNMDGLCAGVIVITSIFRMIMSYRLGDVDGVVLLTILASSYGGFLLFNYKPARIFMGDAGSMFAGFALACLTIACPQPVHRSVVPKLLYPTLTLLYPIFDVVFVSIVRTVAGRPIYVGGKDHTSHRLVIGGLGEQTVVWLLWLLAAAGCLGGLATDWSLVAASMFASLLVPGLILFGIYLARLPSPQRSQRALMPLCSAHKEATGSSISILAVIGAGIDRKSTARLFGGENRD